MKASFSKTGSTLKGLGLLPAEELLYLTWLMGFFALTLTAGLSLMGIVSIALLVYLVSQILRRDRRMGLAYGVVRALCLVVVKFFYRVRTKGMENIPAEGGVLLLCNHVSYVDVVILGVVTRRPIRFLSWEGFERHFLMRWVMRTMNTIPVAEEKAKEAIQKAAEALQSGEIVCIFPEGHVTRNGTIAALRRGYELIARRAGVPLVPLAIDGLWGSIFSFHGGKFFWKMPKHFRRPITVVVGHPYAATEHATTRYRLLELAAEAFAMRPSLQGHLAQDIVRGLSSKAGQVVLIDRTQQRRPFTGAVLWSLSYLLAQYLKKKVKSKRIAIVLPPGVGATVANTACLLADKIPVNVNFTLGREQISSCLSRAEVDWVMTASVFQEKLNEKFPHFPWGNQVIDVADFLLKLSRVKIIWWVLGARLLPSWILAKLCGVPVEGGNREGALLFTSGSSGEPKGVVLSHRNLLANLRQIEDADILPPRAFLLTGLPVFHSFGFTVGLWYCLTRDATVVTIPSPLDTAAAVQAIRDEKITVHVGTPTFIRPYLRRAQAEDFASLEWVVVGAEKLPQDLATAFLKQLETPLLEGYGITETSPVLSVNLPDRLDETAPQGVWKGNVPGSVGRPVMGVAVRFRQVDSGELLAPGEIGLLEVKGANIFSHYLNDPSHTDEVLHQGWYRTGDIGRMDEEGFLYLSGRLSRFSKIGGEMVPHGLVEQALLKVLGCEGQSDWVLAVTARTDAVKGEHLVVIHTLDIDSESVQVSLVTAGLPNLWIPKVFKKVPKIPILGTGKLDLNTLRQLAQG